MLEIVMEIEEGGHRRRLALTKSLILIGRSAGCDVQLTSPQVSARHARLRVYEGSVVLEDLQSSNGVLVDGVRLTAPRALTTASVVQLGAGGPKLQVVSGAGVSAPAVGQVGRLGGATPTLAVGLAAGCLVFAILGVAAGGLFVLQTSIGGNAVTALSESELAPAVGMVIVGLETADSPAKYLPLGTGSAFPITSDGFFLTNKHVIAGVRDGTAIPDDIRKVVDVKGVQVWIAISGKLYPAEIRYVSGENDLGILKIEQRRMPYFRLSSKDNIEQLTPVFAVGYPGAARMALSAEEKFEDQLRSKPHDNIRQFFKDRDFEYTLTDGTVSKLSKESNGRKWIQSTALFSPGNSGGPLCLRDGTVVGINTQGHAESGVRLSLCVGQLRREIEAVTGNASWAR